MSPGAGQGCPSVTGDAQPPSLSLGQGGLAGLEVQEGAWRCEGLEAAGISPSAVFGFKICIILHPWKFCEAEIWLCIPAGLCPPFPATPFPCPPLAVPQLN